MYVSDECCVCMEAMEEGSVRTLSCGHAFHASCLDVWEASLNNKGRPARCPICQREYGPAPPPPPEVNDARTDLQSVEPSTLKTAILLALTSSAATALMVIAWGACSAFALQESE